MGDACGAKFLAARDCHACRDCLAAGLSKGGVVLLSKFRMISLSAAAAVAIGTVAVGPSFAADIVGLITKTETNPFFVKMREGAQEKAKELGIELRTAAGKYDGDNDGQVAAIENLIAAGAKGFAIVPSDSTAIVPTIKKARDAGLKVIVLDTPLDPMN